MNQEGQPLARQGEEWPTGGDEAGTIIRTKDWAKTPLGPKNNWPQSLRASLDMCLRSNSLISICWGNDLYFFYNDVWKDHLGDGYCPIMGTPAQEAFSDSWHKIGSSFEQVLFNGQAVDFEYCLFPSDKEDLTDSYFEFSLNPIIKTDGSVGGVFCIANQVSKPAYMANVWEGDERRFRQMIDALPVPIYATDAEGLLTYFNPAAVRFSGRMPQLGSDQWCVSWKLYHPDGRPMPYETCPMAVALKEGRSVTGVEVIVERPDGERMHLEPYPSPLYNKAGELIGGINMMIDVTEHKQAEQQLRRSELELADFFDNATLGLHWVGPDGTILRANQAELDMLGYSREEYVGRSIADFHADQEVIDDILQRLSVGEELQEYEARLRHKDGSIRHVLISSNVYREDGEFVHTRCFTRDVTRQKVAEEDLAIMAAESEQKRRLYETVLSSTPDFAYVFDLKYRFIYANEALLEMWGQSFEEAMGKTLLEIGYEPWHAEMHEREIDQVVETKQPVRGEVPFPHATLGQRIYDYIFVPVFNDKGEVEAVAGTTRDITARKKTEEELRKSEEKYRNLFENIDEGFAIVQVLFDEDEEPVDYRFLEVNSAFERHTGLKNAQGKRIRELVPGIEQQWPETYGEVVLTGEPIRFEDSSEALNRWFDVYAFPFGDPHEQKVAILFNDITNRKRNEYNNALLGAIVEGSDDAIISKNMDGIITSWNSGAERMFGYTAEEAIGQSITMLIPDERLDEETQIINQVEAGKKIEQFETVRMRKDGALLHVSLTISPVRDSTGHIIGASKIARDITDRIQAEQVREQLLREVETERERLIDIFQHAPSIMCILRGADHVFERANNMYKQIVGNRKLVGKPVREAIPEAEEQGFTELLDQVYQTGETFVGIDMKVELQRHPGDKSTTEVHYVDFVYQPIRNAAGDVTGVFFQGVDLTERRLAEEKLQAMNEVLEERVKERTASLVAYQEQLRSLAFELSKAEERERQRLATELHDNLGQMLAVGKMKVDLLQRTPLPEPVAGETRELAGLVDEAIRYTRELMTELKPPPSLEQENLVTSLHWVAEKMAKHGLQVHIDDDGRKKPLKEDVKSTLLQCTRELLFNVVKHAGVDEARLALKRQGGRICLTVTDKGRGFDLDGTQPAPTESGGFGLFNVLERIDLLGGELQVNTAPGRGTTVWVALPVKSKGKVTRKKTPSKTGMGDQRLIRSGSPANTGRQIRVLLADDHRMMREGLRKLIEEEEDMLVIAEATDGQEAVRLAAEVQPEVVVMDVNMPVMDGIEATRHIRTKDAQVRIIGLSLQEEKRVAKAMRKAGASAYLTKSDVFETLCAAIRSEAQIMKRKGKN